MTISPAVCVPVTVAFNGVFSGSGSETERVEAIRVSGGRVFFPHSARVVTPPMNLAERRLVSAARYRESSHRPATFCLPPRRAEGISFSGASDSTNRGVSKAGRGVHTTHPQTSLKEESKTPEGRRFIVSTNSSGSVRERFFPPSWEGVVVFARRIRHARADSVSSLVRCCGSSSLCAYKVTVISAEDVLKATRGPYPSSPNHLQRSPTRRTCSCGCGRSSKCGRCFWRSNFQNPLLAPVRVVTPRDQNAGHREGERRRQAPRRRSRWRSDRGPPSAARTSSSGRAARLSRDGTERLGGARTAADVLAAVPNCTVVLARTRGLWGSMFSWADGQPSLLNVFFRGIGLWVANLFVFAPRRKVTVTLEAFTPSNAPQPTREARQ